MIDKTIDQMVDEFAKAFGTSDDLSLVDKIKLRRSLIKEEYEEVMVELDKLITLETAYEQRLLGATLGAEFESCSKILEDIYDTHKKILKELCDLTYVNAGCAHALGMNFDGALLAVHRSNMSKLGPDGKPIYREDGKVLKGPSYKPAVMDPYV